MISLIFEKALRTFKHFLIFEKSCQIFQENA